MSELAFDANGEAITFPAGAEELRVRRFRNPGMRGACEVVHDREGAPLYVPVDTSYIEFRALVDALPGRYRLDPVDAARQVMANAAPAYVTITEPARNGTEPRAAEDRDSVIRELARANAEMTKTIADRFAGVMQAAADLIRAADGAGLPRREPLASMPAEAADGNEDADDDDDDDEHDDGEGEGDRDSSADIASLIAQLLPMIQMWLSARTAEKTAAAVPAAVPHSAHGPAPAAVPATPSDDMAAEVGTAAGSEPERSGPAPDSRMPAEPSGAAQTTTSDVTGGASTSAPADPNAAPTTRNAGRAWSPGQMDHLLAVHAALLPDEKRIVQLVVARMTPEVRTQWLDELSGLTVDEAVALVRSLIPRIQRKKESES
jgi:hypothetical protein